QAGAAHLVLLDHGHRQARGARVQGRGIAAGPATDHDYVELRRLSSVRWQTDHLLVSTMTQPPDRPPTGRGRSSARPWHGLRTSLMTLDWLVDEVARRPAPHPDRPASSGTDPPRRRRDVSPWDAAACRPRPWSWSARPPARSCPSPCCPGTRRRTAEPSC